VTNEVIYETRMISDMKYQMPEKDKKDIEELLEGGKQQA